MEQKQLDEIEESFMGEEFIDDEDILIEEVKPKNRKRPLRREGAKAEPAKAEFKPGVRAEKVFADEKGTATGAAAVGDGAVSREAAEEEEWVELGQELSKEPASRKGSAFKGPSKELAAKKEKETPKGKEIRRFRSAGVAEPAPGSAGDNPRAAEPANPWAAAEEAPGKDSPLWKTVTAIAIVLLIFSVVTDGFNFSKESAGGLITLAEAEKEAEQFVNTYLLQPPFAARAIASEEMQGLYKVTLSVAGQRVDSFMTKDGKLFFPQGFDTVNPFNPAAEGGAEGNAGSPDESDPTENESELVEEIVIDGTSGQPVVQRSLVPREENNDSGNGSSNPNGTAAANAEADNATGNAGEGDLAGAEAQQTGPRVYDISSRKWSFSISKITVQVGDQVVFNLRPDNSNPSFALPEYTFALPEFGVEQQVSGPTTVEFTASTAGSFRYFCSSCGDKQEIMAGTLVVE